MAVVSFDDRYFEAEFGAGRVNLNPGTFGTLSLSARHAISAFDAQNNGWPLGQYQAGRTAMAQCRMRIATLWPGPQSALGTGTTAQISGLVPELARILGPATLLTTTDEHEGALAGFLRHPSFTVVRVAPANLVAAIRSQRPGLVLVSSVNWTDARAMPVAEVVAAAGDAWVIHDVAQTLGNGEPSLIGDIVVGSLHKWVAGPAGTGLTWMSERARMHLQGTVWAGHPMDESHPLAHFEPSGGQDFSRWAGLLAAICLYHSVGISAAQARSQALGLRVAEMLADRVSWLQFFDGTTDSSKPCVTSGNMVVVRFADRDPYPVYQQLEAAKIHVKCIKEAGHNQLRIGVPWWERQVRIEKAARVIAAAIVEHT